MKRDAIDFANEKVPVLFRKLLLPTLLGSISMSAVTAIDGIFVGHGTGADGVAAINFIVPLYQIMSGIGLMIGTGCSVLASIHLSRGNVRVAKINVSQAMIVSSLIVLMLCILAFISPAGVARMIGSSETLLPQVVDYMLWIMPSYIFMMWWSMIGLFIIRLDGSPRYAMWCNIVPALLNVVFDWLFIFQFGLGVKGAAIATSISHVAGGGMALYYLAFKAERLRLVSLKLSGKSLALTIRNIGYQCRVGSSSHLGELMMAVFIYSGNYTFMRYLGDAGAGVCVSMLFVSVPDVLVKLFVDADSEAGMIAVGGFPYFACGIVFFILNVAVIGYCQSIEQIRRTTLFVLLRGLVLLVPCFIVLPILLGDRGIWLAMPVAELGTTLIIFTSFMFSSIAPRRG